MYIYIQKKNKNTYRFASQLISHKKRQTTHYEIKMSRKKENCNPPIDKKISMSKPGNQHRFT